MNQLNQKNLRELNYLVSLNYLMNLMSLKMHSDLKHLKYL
jgi:hypothetical protein